MIRTAGFIICLSATVPLGGCKGTEQPDMTLQQFMAQKIDPASKIYFSAVSSTSELVGDKVVNRDIAPRTEAEWEKVRQAAADLQAQGKQLQTPAYTEGRNADWTQFSQSLVEVSQQAEQAAKDKDPEKVFEVSGTMYAVCDACHMAYPKDATQPGGGSAR